MWGAAEAGAAWELGGVESLLPGAAVCPAPAPGPVGKKTQPQCADSQGLCPEAVGRNGGDGEAGSAGGLQGSRSEVGVLCKADWRWGAAVMGLVLCHRGRPPCNRCLEG